jgi:hypothetical protein
MLTLVAGNLLIQGTFSEQSSLYRRASDEQVGSVIPEIGAQEWAARRGWGEGDRCGDPE